VYAYRAKFSYCSNTLVFKNLVPVLEDGGGPANDKIGFSNTAFFKMGTRVYIY